ncbi:MAG: AfsR/SARP family transcriptional regulator [Chloroflexota bacterium]|jgi:DNA-binding SARP family transcriptional activator
MSTEAPETKVGLQFRLLGQPQLFKDGADIATEIGAKPLALMAYLAMNAPARIPRAKLASTFWSDKSEEASRYRLRHTLWELRKTLGKDQIQSDDSACWFNIDEATWIDAQQFLRGLQEHGIGIGGKHQIPQDLASFSLLLLLYRGELLEGLTVRDAPVFDEWLLVERERIHLLFIEGLWHLARAQVEAGRPREAIQTLTRLIEADPLRERNYRALMQLHIRNGDRSAAMQVYKRCSAMLAAELGVSPSSRTQLLYEIASKGITESAANQLQRAGELLAQRRFDEAKSACSAAESLGADPIISSQVAILRAEIAMAEGKSGESLKLLQTARLALTRLMPKPRG